MSLDECGVSTSANSTGELSSPAPDHSDHSYFSTTAVDSDASATTATRSDSSKEAQQESCQRDSNASPPADCITTDDKGEYN